MQRETWSRYESGALSPGTDVWVALATAGADVLYILTGARAAAPPASPLAPDEAALLDNYRHTPADKRGAIREVGAALAQRPSSRLKHG